MIWYFSGVLSTFGYKIWEGTSFTTKEVVWCNTSPKSPFEGIPPTAVSPTCLGSAPIMMEKIYLTVLEFLSTPKVEFLTLPPPLMLSDIHQICISTLAPTSHHCVATLRWFCLGRQVLASPSLSSTQGTKTSSSVCIPFYGTAKKPKQMKVMLISSLSNTFTTQHGYIHFSHAIRVLVV